MRTYREHALDVILLLGTHSDNTLTAAVLRGVNARCLTLDVACMAHRDNAGMALDKILENYLVLHRNKLGAAVVAEASLDGKQLVADNALYALLAREDSAELAYCCGQLCDAVEHLLSLESGQTAERHFDDSLRLCV